MQMYLIEKMGMNILGIAISFAYTFILLWISPKIAKFDKEAGRKFPHIFSFMIWIIGNYFYNNLYFALVFPFVMMILMAFSYKFNLFKGIERENQIRSYGTVYYFVSIGVLTVISFLKYDNLIPLGAYFMILCFGDGFAALIGKKVNWIPYKVGQSIKTVSGNIAMFIFSVVSFYIYSEIFNLDYLFFEILLISFIATIFETISIKGLDNLTIPIGTYIIFEGMRYIA